MHAVHYTLQDTLRSSETDKS